MACQLALRARSTPWLISSCLQSHPCQNNMAPSSVTLGMHPAKYFLFKRLKKIQRCVISLCQHLICHLYPNHIARSKSTVRDKDRCFHWEHKNKTLLFSLNYEYPISLCERKRTFNHLAKKSLVLESQNQQLMLSLLYHLFY